MPFPLSAVPFPVAFTWTFTTRGWTTALPECLVVCAFSLLHHSGSNSGKVFCLFIESLSGAWHVVGLSKCLRKWKSFLSVRREYDLPSLLSWILQCSFGHIKLRRVCLKQQLTDSSCITLIYKQWCAGKCWKIGSLGGRKAPFDYFCDVNTPAMADFKLLTSCQLASKIPEHLN